MLEARVQPINVRQLLNVESLTGQIQQEGQLIDPQMTCIGLLFCSPQHSTASVRDTVLVVEAALLLIPSSGIKKPGAVKRQLPSSSFGHLVSLSSNPDVNLRGCCCQFAKAFFCQLPSRVDRFYYDHNLFSVALYKGYCQLVIYRASLHVCFLCVLFVQVSQCNV